MISEAVVRVVLRTIAILIAVAALVDPVMTVARTPQRPVVVAQLASSDSSVIVAAIRSAVPGAEVVVREANRGRLPCAPGDACVMVADGSVDIDIPGDFAEKVSLVRAGLAPGPNVALKTVTASLTQHAAGSGMIRVSMAGAGVKGRRTELRVSDSAAIVGIATHDWVADGDATVDVPWWPLAAGARSLRVAAVPLDGEAATIDNVVDVGVSVASTRAPVLVFDARPSWASTLVRRALEDDSRFLVEHRVGLGPALSAGTPGGRLNARTLDAASVVIVGGPEGLSPADVTLLERYIGTRGGTLLLLPDRAPAGAATRLFPGRWTEHLEATVSPAGALQATETLRLASPAPTDVVLASVKGSPAIVLSPSGNGRIIVSGALDAWRHRDADGVAFDRFWRSLVLEAAPLGAPLALEFASAATRPGASVPLVVRHRRMEPGGETEIAATATCGQDVAKVVRLWPAGPDGVFAGVVTMDGEGSCEIRVVVEGAAVSGGVAISSGATLTVPSVMAKLERAAQRSGGVVTSADEVAAVSAAFAAAESAVPTPVHPMRSPWWMFPFVTALCVEWWLRRRAGLR